MAMADAKTVIRDLTSSIEKNFLMSGVQCLSPEQLLEPTDDRQGS
jgi:hypothetical protein